MNKQEIEHKLEQAQKDMMGIKDNILWLKEQLVEAEKPKLGHGDFGINKEGARRIRVFKNAMPDRGASDDYSPYGICSDTDFLPFGNIFELMKDWGVDLEQWDSEKGREDESITMSIKNCPGNRMWLGTCGNSDWYKIEVIEEIWRKLGQMLMTLKRKQSKT